MAKMHIERDPQPAPATAFTDAGGARRTLADFKGQVVLVNLWANWCAPCKVELPSLAKLQARMAGKPFKVVAISLGKDDDEVYGRKFIATLPPLAFYSEPTYALAFAFKPPAEGLPASFLVDKQGRIRARLDAQADWSGPDAERAVEILLKE
jgi:thiol-disulfide isomerase/thioredoxin